MPTTEKIEEALGMLHGEPDRFRPMLEAEAVLNRICNNAKAKADRDNRPPWSVISDLTGHGSGLSAAIFRVYGPEE